MTSPAQKSDLGVLSSIGATPLVALKRLVPSTRFRLYAKLEHLNPGGSLKDRAALTMLLDGLRTGEIDQSTTIIESSSGNMGIGLAQACCYLGLPFICVTDIRSTPTNRRIMQAFGATVEVIEKPDPDSGDFLSARLKRVKQLLDTFDNSYNCDQYRNPNNPFAHRKTMSEILTSLPEVDYVFCATSSCGTLRGCSEFIAERGLKTKLVAVDAVGSVIFGDNSCSRLIPGHGAAVKPPLYKEGLEHLHLQISDVDCVIGCRRLISREAIFAGGSTGAVVAAVSRLEAKIPDDSVCVAIVCDRGDRYLDTIYSDTWVEEHFGALDTLNWGKGKHITHV